MMRMNIVLKNLAMALCVAWIIAALINTAQARSPLELSWDTFSNVDEMNDEVSHIAYKSIDYYDGTRRRFIMAYSCERGGDPYISVQTGYYSAESRPDIEVRVDGDRSYRVKSIYSKATGTILDPVDVSRIKRDMTSGLNMVVRVHISGRPTVKFSLIGAANAIRQVDNRCTK